MKKLLLLLLCFPLLFSCGENEKDNNIEDTEKNVHIPVPLIGVGQIKVNRTDSKSTAKAILIAYKSKDLRTLSSLSNSYNVERMDEIIEQGDRHPRYSSLWKGWRWDAVNNWDEYSLEIIEDNRESSIKKSKVKFGESEEYDGYIEDYVVTLYWEDGKWCFEDIHSPRRKEEIEEEEEEETQAQEEVQNNTTIDTTYKEMKLEQLNNNPKELEKFARKNFLMKKDNEDIIIIKEKRTYIFPNGDKYVGEYMDGKRHGKGTFISTKGDKYVGEWKDGLFNGQGTYTWGEGNNKGDKYVGEWKNGKHNGQGTYTWGEGDNKGDKYVGEFINNQKTGQGTCTYANGEKYVGEWKDGKSHGEGVYTLADGEIIEGLFEDGQYKNILSGEYNDGGTTIDFDNGEKYIVE